MGEKVGLFDDLFSDDMKKRAQAFGLFSFLNEMEEENENTDELIQDEEDNYNNENEEINQKNSKS